MALRDTKFLMLGKIEVTYGTDPVPTGAANALLVRRRNMPEPSTSDYVDRNLMKPWQGRSQQFKANSKVTLGFDMELAGSGTAGTAPAWGPIVRACGFAETIVAVTSAAYNPISAAEESATIYYHLDGMRQKSSGLRGSLGLSLKAGEIPLITVDGIGLYTEPTDTAMAVPTFTSWKDPLVANKLNTTTGTLHGFAAIIRELSLTMGQPPVYRDWVNGTVIDPGNRTPGGSITLELPSIAAKNYFALDAANTLGALAIVHGTVAGNIIQIDAPKVQVMNPKFSSESGIALLTLDLALVPNAGNDELIITAK